MILTCPGCKALNIIHYNVLHQHDYELDYQCTRCHEIVSVTYQARIKGSDQSRIQGSDNETRSPLSKGEHLTDEG